MSIWNKLKKDRRGMTPSAMTQKTCILDSWANVSNPTLFGCVPVYWFPEKETGEDPRLSWSLTKDNYYPIYNSYKPRS